jgi:hypothetical protein
MIQDISPIIASIAKIEQNYIEEWIRWHIALGFAHIYLYDNEDSPTYESQLNKYKNFVTVIHIPGNNYNKGVQYLAYDHFVKNFMLSNGHTHAMNLDIDEFIVLHHHKNIKNFIDEFIVDDCGAIGINWRYFGDSNHKTVIDEPQVKRFTHRQKTGNEHIKTLFKIDAYNRYKNVHCVELNNPLVTKNTNGTVITGPYNKDLDFRFIQINHYKSKTLEEFKLRYKRLRPDISAEKQTFNPNILPNIFRSVNYNETEDLSAYNYLSTVNSFWEKLDL